MISRINTLKRELLRQCLVDINSVIKPAFSFGEIKREELPYDQFIVLTLNKIYSMNVSIENNLLLNDVHQSVSVFRYFYELYIKVFYIFSEPLDLQRLEDFNSGKRVIISHLLEKIDSKLLPPEFQNNHKDHYKKVCDFVHPNIESLNMHYGKTDDQIFEFIVPNIVLTIWLQVNTIIPFQHNATTESLRNINLENLNKILGRLNAV